ncbi:Stp1/IreP family PP2C-type Ser/Thr phosphatase [Aquibacillus kalidii]|uniref:Stp1/IreP family PP2C-type Ser/Thr phosphatase n=1 Tax=Aquibacillus kalidii TaxID=2762597 RepID=UPI00164870FB|nr:Stp1/IreP family PP2C-type Ser/Thr phosphatase [Aquibacillus kalidii]
MNGYFLTDTGKVREHNEDSGAIFVNSNNQLLAIVADGMGGHKAGDVASQMVISSLGERWDEDKPFSTPGDAEQWLSDSILETNNKVYAYAQENEECSGMGTTVVAVICTSDFISIAHIGDSRCYLYNDQGYKQVTEDHSLVNELVKTGQISKEDAEYHPRKNVLLRALGTEVGAKPDIQTIGWDVRNSILICSDGLTNKVLDNELEEYIKEDMELKDIAQRLIDLANERGGEDNISVALVKFYDSPKEGETEC